MNSSERPTVEGEQEHMGEGSKSQETVQANIESSMVDDLLATLDLSGDINETDNLSNHVRDVLQEILNIPAVKAIRLVMSRVAVNTIVNAMHYHYRTSNNQLPSAVDLLDILSDEFVDMSEDSSQDASWIQDKKFMETLANRKEKTQLRQELKRHYTEQICPLCMLEQSNIMALPCAHTCMCDTCKEKAEVCPICLTKIKCVVKIYRT